MTKKYRVEALEKFVVRTVYLVEADNAKQAEEYAKEGYDPYEKVTIEEGDEEWIETVSVEEGSDV
jgi:Uma2 family endonuclease